MKRTLVDHVEFRRPFRLKGLDGVQPPGIYTTIIEEELLEAASVSAWHRVATSIRLPAVGTPSNQYQDNAVNPQDLRDALAKDLAPANT